MNITVFDNRSKQKKTLLMVLAGYKHELYDNVFDRLKKFCPEWIDVCLLTSGKLDEQVRQIAKRYQWSYMSSDINNLCLIQNECIKQFKSASSIFKMDEDMFMTDRCFEKMILAYTKAENRLNIVPGFIVPIINVNCRTYLTLLKKDRQIYERFVAEFGKPVITNGLHHHQYILEDSDVAKFMWMNFDIDYENHKAASSNTLTECGTRFSIGLVYFKRSTFEMMGGFEDTTSSKLDWEQKGLGVDERQICRFAMMKAMPIIIDESTVVGHLGYGPQTNDMLDIYKEHQLWFSLHDLI